MESEKLEQYYERFKYGEDNFHNLMQFRVRTILLVSTIYDAYILEHDSVLSEQIVVEYHQLNLTTIPRIIHISTGVEALEKLEGEKVDLVITTMHIGEMTPFSLASKIKEINPDLPVLLLLTVQSDCTIITKEKLQKGIDRVFLWNGDSGIFLAMIKHIEDRMNADRDTAAGGVRVLVFIEDSIGYYSFYLPCLYREIMEQTQRLISEELNDVNKYFRMKSRPKILLATDYEEALSLCNRYADSLLGVISDMEIPIDGVVSSRGGINLLTCLKESGFDLPFLLQSSDRESFQNTGLSDIPFIWKKSPTLVRDLRDFIMSDLGFGDFLFRDEKGQIYGQAHSVIDFEGILKDIPLESLWYHGEHNHFSAWLSAHGEFPVARNLRTIKVSDFTDGESLRRYLIEQFIQAREKRIRGQIVNFSAEALAGTSSIIRIGAGSLGGKGRGLAFFNALLSGMYQLNSGGSSGARIPSSIIIATSEYDYFLQSNSIPVSDLPDMSDDEIKNIFLNSSLSPILSEKLYLILDIMEKPIAVRSSGLLEDSHTQPFAGVYQTYILPNCGDREKKIRYLSDSIKLVYASVFLSEARNYQDSLNLNGDEEKMAVIIQELVGANWNGKFYPQLSGTAQSYNYYPVSHLTPEDGVARLALGFGHIIAGGGKSYMYCPRWPEIPFQSQEELLKNSQNHFFSIDLSCDREYFLLQGEEATLKNSDLLSADTDNALKYISSRVDRRTGHLSENSGTEGYPVLTFRDIVKHNRYPLSEIITSLLEIGEKSFGSPVEIEFAVDSFIVENPCFYLLQIRPLNLNNMQKNTVDIDGLDSGEMWIRSDRSMGNGVIEDIRDILLVHGEDFSTLSTLEIAQEIGEFNRMIKKENRRYILIGPGRWGSRDLHLGIPVTWSQISQCSVLIETGLADFDPEPSLGSHFLHNIISKNVGYLSIPYHGGDGSRMDREWLESREIAERGQFVRHIQLKEPVKAILDGKRRIAVITKI